MPDQWRKCHKRHKCHMCQKCRSGGRCTDRLLLVLTDGKPNDLDRYEGRYGIEDTRMALHEARRAGVRSFCVAVDDRARDYLPYLLGSNAKQRGSDQSPPVRP